MSVKFEFILVVLPLLVNSLLQSDKYQVAVPYYNYSIYNQDVETQNFYPKFSRLYDLLENWHPHTLAEPKPFHEHLHTFNFTEPFEKDLARQYRELELPFKILGIPSLLRASFVWTDDYILRNAKKKAYVVERSSSNHFLYWKTEGKDISINYVPPTGFVNMTLEEWMTIKTTISSPNSPHFYVHMNAYRFAPSSKHFITRDLPFLASKRNNLFISDVHNNQGIECRFGMKGIIAEAHSDSGRNFVASIRGNRRIIMTPPYTCKNLGINMDVKHPSYRQSRVDWCNKEEIKKYNFHLIDAIETILHPGEVLFIPSFWFHYIVSLDVTIQCNSHSSFTSIGKEDIDRCFRIE